MASFKADIEVFGEVEDSGSNSVIGYQGMSVYYRTHVGVPTEHS